MIPRIQTFTWLPLLDLPPVPEHFVNRALSLTANPVQNHSDNYIMQKLGAHTVEYKNRKITYQGQEMQSLVHEGHPMGEDFEQWIRDNIWAGPASDILARGSHGNSTVHGAHVDRAPGKYKLNYILDDGGDNVETVFYHVPGQSYIFDPDNNVNNVPLWHDNMDELEIVDSVRLPKHTWILLNGFFMHAAVNIDHSTRRQISVSIPPESVTFGVQFRKTTQ